MLFHALLIAISYIGYIAINDFREFRLGIQVWNQTEQTENCYNWFEQYLKKGYDNDLERDYSEGIFDDDYSLTLKEATLKKYEYIYEKLGLKPGMKLLDAGCGTGVWMEFCRQRGVEVVGLTLSSEQAKKVEEKGLEVHVMDYRTMHESFLNQFDRITALGSSEHVCSSVGALNGDMAATNCNNVRIDVWKLFHSYLKPGGKAFITMLTANPNATFWLKDWAQAYLLTRHYGGYYSSMDDIVNKVVPETGFVISDQQDKTKDYYWSSVVDKDHFGQWSINWQEDTGAKLFYALQGIVYDRFWAHHWLHYLSGAWMWQFRGDNENPLSDEQLLQSPVHLKYFMLE